MGCYAILSKFSLKQDRTEEHFAMNREQQRIREMRMEKKQTMKIRVEQMEYSLRGTTRVSTSFSKRDLNFTNATICSDHTVARDVDVVQTVPILLNQTIRRKLTESQPKSSLNSVDSRRPFDSVVIYTYIRSEEKRKDCLSFHAVPRISVQQLSRAITLFSYIYIFFSLFFFSSFSFFKNR